MNPITIAFGLAQFAPQIIKWITGSDKAADAATAVVDIAKKVTGRDDGAAAVDAMKADPALVIQFRMMLAAQEADLDKAFLADRQGARARDIEYVHAGKNNVRADLMVLIDAVGLVACMIVLALYHDQLQGEVIALLSTIASIFGLCLRDAHQFEFGSSRSSVTKTDLLMQQSNNK